MNISVISNGFSLCYSVTITEQTCTHEDISAGSMYSNEDIEEIFDVGSGAQIQKRLFPCVVI